MTFFQLPDGRNVGPDNAFEYNGILYPQNFIRLSTADEKAAIGLIELPDPEPPAPGPAPRPLIDKSTILDRLTDGQLSAALAAMTDRQKERWRMPGKPQIYKDDEELVAMLTYIGADLEVVLA